MACDLCFFEVPSCIFKDALQTKLKFRGLKYYLSGSIGKFCFYSIAMMLFNINLLIFFFIKRKYERMGCYLCIIILNFYTMRLIKNKYFISILVFFVWMLFFDQNNFGNRYKLTSKLNNLKKQKAYYLSEIEQNQVMSDKLSHDTAFIEQFAREKYLLKRDNEDIYVIVRE